MSLKFQKGLEIVYKPQKVLSNIYNFQKTLQSTANCKKLYIFFGDFIKHLKPSKDLEYFKNPYRVSNMKINRRFRKTL